MRTSPVLKILSLCGCLAIAACSSGPTGIYPTPVRIPVLDTLATPAAGAAAGENAQFSISWLYGEEPFTVAWSFGGGADPDSLTDTVVERTQASTVTLVNDTGATATYAGSVTVTDNRGSHLVTPFTFAVEPAG